MMHCRYSESIHTLSSTARKVMKHVRVQSCHFFVETTYWKSIRESICTLKQYVYTKLA
jgi:hypothetical protein